MFALHAMCEAQVDFGSCGKKPRSRRNLVWACYFISMEQCRICASLPQWTKECLCEALRRIFEFIDGVPLRILFDNISSAVVHIEEHGKRKLTDIFMRFTMHNRFKAEFCNPDSPNEKGNVENRVGYIRRNYLLPPPKIKDLDKFNDSILSSGVKERVYPEFCVNTKLG